MLNFSSQKILSVSELTKEIKNLLESDFRFVRISGEISNLKVPYSGHSYFTLKDSGAQLRAVLFKQQKRFVNLPLKDGQQVVCFGRISVYEPRGDYQLIVDSVDLHGTGQLQLLFEELKKRLAEKGYFSAERKKPIPFFPAHIAVITSPTGAALQDFLKIAKLRKSPVKITILPVRVQGNEAAQEIAGAVKIAAQHLDPDVIVLCRGGGSLEDLWAFNEEVVADAIASCKIPLITGVGHETDFTIADFCSDHRCPTPTGAAEFLIPDGEELRRTIQEQKRNLYAVILRKIDLNERSLKQQIRLLGTLESTFVNSEYRLQLSISYLVQAILGRINSFEKRISEQKHKLQRLQPSHEIVLKEARLSNCFAKLQANMQRILERKEDQLSKQASLLNSVSPLATLGRGYAVARKYARETQGYTVITSSDEVRQGEVINVLLKNGELDCEVRKIINKEDSAE